MNKHKNLTDFAQERGIKYFMVSYTDLLGVQRTKLVPTPAIAGMEKDGAGFAGFASWFDMSPADEDMLALPDASGVVQLPWKKDVAWVPSNCHIGGGELQQTPRVVLGNLLAQAADKGFRIMTGVEPEFFLINSDGTAISDPMDKSEKPCYDQQALMRRYDVISEICDGMLDLGWGTYQNDHEDANGQFEMNWMYNDAMVTADQHSFFKFMVRSIAENHGMRGTFMPKPFTHLTGNGCHVHISLWQDGKNVFADDNDELGLSQSGYHFLGGIVHYARSLAILTNPTVNSYKRINAPPTTSGATWAPNTVTWTGNNRTHMIRVPAPGRFELRLADGAANPYLLQAAAIAAGLAGLENKIDPGKRHDIDMYKDGHTLKDVPKLPLYMIDAIRLFEEDKGIQSRLGNEFSAAYIAIKYREWNSYCHHLSAWERENTLDV